MSAVDVCVHRREAVGETLSDETLCSQVITLVKIIATDDMKNAGIAFEACGMEGDLVQEMRDPVGPAFGRFQRNATHEAVHLVTQGQKFFRQVASILSGDSSNERFLFSHVAMPTIENGR